MALLYDQPRSATVTTLEPTTLYRLRKADFDWLLSEAGAAERELERVSSRRRRVDFESAARAQFGP
jgi:CRP-like cAMP-binding protein